jgi:cell division protein FtsA
MAERASGKRIDSAYFNFADEHISSFNRSGHAIVSTRSPVIAQSHVTRAVESTMGVHVENGHEVLHYVPRSFCVDGQYRVTNPLGMHGKQLDVETHVVAGATSSVRNTMRAIHAHGMEIDELVVGPLAAAEAVLANEEKEAGVLLIDMGGGTTDIVVFSEGGVSYTGVIGVGGAHLTSDIAIGLKVPLHIAEQIKLKAGRCGMRASDAAMLVGVPAFDSGLADEVPLRFLVDICQARIEEMFEAVMDVVADSGFRSPLPGGVVLTGGAASLNGVVELARHLFNLPVRLGLPRGIVSDNRELSGPALAVGTGLVLWGMRNGHPELRGRGDAGWHSVRRRVGQWLRHLAP